MSDQFNFEAILKFGSEGAEARLQELGEMASNLETLLTTTNRGSQSFKGLQERLRAIQAAMKAYGDEVEKANSGTNKGEAAARGLSKRYAKLEETLRNVAAGFRDAQLAGALFDAQQAGLGKKTMERDPRTWTTEQLQAYQQLKTVEQQTFDGAVREELQRREEAANSYDAALGRLAAATQELRTLDQHRADVAGEQEQISAAEELSRAQQRVADATRERDKAQAAIRSAQKAGDEERETAALDRKSEAVKELNSAREAQARVEQKISQESDRIAESFAANERRRTQQIIADREAQAKAAEKASEAAGLEKIRQEEEAQRAYAAAVKDSEAAATELAKAREGLDYANATQELGKAEAATQKLLTAERRLADAKEETAAAEASGDPARIAAARRNEAQATRDADAAVRGKAAAHEQEERAIRSAQDRMMQMRYGLYDISNTAFITSAALFGVGVGATSAFSSLESGFSQVAQTNMDRPVEELARIEEEVKQIASELPVTVDELQGLAAIAGQLNISGDIGAFVESMAMLGMIAEDISAEEAAEKVARFVNVMGGAETIETLSGAENAYFGVAGAVAQVAVSTAASEGEILHSANNLGIVAAQTRMTTDEVIGLSAALVAMGQPAERSRSAMQNFVSVMNKGVAGQGVENLQAMADVMGTTVDEISRLWQNDPTQFLVQFLRSMKNAAAEGRNMTEMISSFGLEGQRATPVFSAMANNVDQLTEALTQSATGFTSATDESSVFQARIGEITEDLASSWQRLKNVLLLAAGAVGSALGPALNQLAQTLIPIIQGFTEWAESDIGQRVITWGIQIGGLIATAALFIGVTARAAGAWYAFRSALEAGNLGTVAQRLFGIKTAADATATGMGNAARGTLTFAGALRVLGRATVVIGLLQLLMELIFNTKNTLGALANYVFWVARVWFNAMEGMGITVSGLAQTVGGAAKGIIQWFENIVNIAINAWNSINRLFGAGQAQAQRVDFSSAIQGINELQSAASQFDWGDMRAGLDAMEDQINQWAERGKHANKIDLDFDFDQSQFDINDILAGLDEDLAKELGKAVGDGIGGGAKKGADKAKKELRTLVDYASDLRGVFDRAFDLRFSVSIARDGVDTAFLDMADAVDAAKKSVRDLRQEIRQLRADMMATNASITQTEYFLSVALDYGDTKRAEELQAELAKLEAERAKQQSDLTDKTKELSQAEEWLRMSLTGNSRAAIEHRASLLGLLGAYQDYLIALAESGASQEELAAAARVLKREFVQQALSLGYSRDEVRRYAVAFDDLRYIINRIPRNVTIEFSTPGRTAVLEYLAQVEESVNNINDALNGGGGGGMPDIPGGGGPLVKRGVVLPDPDWSWMREADPDNPIVIPVQPEYDEDAGDEASKSFWDWLSETFGPHGVDQHTRGSTGGGLASLSFVRAFLAGVDTVPGEMRKVGSEGANNFLTELMTRLGILPPQLNTLGGTAGRSLGSGLNKTAPATGRSFASALASGISPVRTTLGKAGTDAGNSLRSNALNSVARGLAAGMKSRAKGGGNAFRTEFQKYGTSAGNNTRNRIAQALRYDVMRSIGRSAGSALGAGIAEALRGRKMGTVKVTKAGSITLGFRQGGYTGAGPAHAPAGIVHRGEYVIPKHMVNQRTGLPHVDALGKLYRGNPARNSYAGGGYAGGDGTILVEYTAHGLRQLAKAFPDLNLRIGADSVARATNAANFSAAKRGSN